MVRPPCWCQVYSPGLALPRLVAVQQAGEGDAAELGQAHGQYLLPHLSYTGQGSWTPIQPAPRCWTTVSGWASGSAEGGRGTRLARAGASKHVLSLTCRDRGAAEVRPFAALRVTTTASVILSKAKNPRDGAGRASIEKAAYSMGIPARYLAMSFFAFRS
jgi:hypothetical protein